MKSQVYQLLLKYPLESLSEQDVCDIAWEFLECVTDILVQKIRWAAERNHCKTF
jgi:tRNA A37 threonylcarbamoyltransferase TsaD